MQRVDRFRGLFHNLPAAACFSAAASIGTGAAMAASQSSATSMDRLCDIDLTCLQLALALQQFGLTLLKPDMNLLGRRRRHGFGSIGADHLEHGASGPESPRLHELVLNRIDQDPHRLHAQRLQAQRVWIASSARMLCNSARKTGSWWTQRETVSRATPASWRPW